MAIYILEDEQIQAKFLKDYINTYLTKELKQEHVLTFSRPDDLLEILQISERNLYLLDIQIKSDLKAGLSIAKEIRQRDTQALIAFVTSHHELALEALQTMVSAIMFIYKNVDAHTFTEQINQVLVHYFAQDEIEDEAIFVLKTKNAYISERQSDILYFEVTGNHQISLVSKHKTTSFYGTLKEIMERDGGFLRVHQAYLINPKQIRLFDKKEKLIELSNGIHVPVSRTYLSDVEQLFKGW